MPETKLHSKPSAHNSDRYFQNLIVGVGLAIVLIFALCFYQLLSVGGLSLKTFGWDFISSLKWSPSTDEYGILPFIVGTLLTSILALCIAVPLAVASAIFITEYAPKWLAEPVSYLIELLSAIPSVIYGLWAVFVLVPIVRNIQIAILQNESLQQVPWLVSAPTGFGLFTAVVILAVMIIPYTASVARDVIRLVPSDQREAAYALGATKWEVISMAILPYARAGIFGGVILSLGRALGETMAVTMVIGNNNVIPSSIFGASNTMASVIALEFAEASSDLHVSSLLALGLVLLVISVIVNYSARLIIARLTPKGLKA